MMQKLTQETTHQPDNSRLFVNAEAVQFYTRHTTCAIMTIWVS